MISKVIAEDLVHKVKYAINEADSIAMVIHVGPDGDAMGASLGMLHYLKSCGKSPFIVAPSAFPAFYEWMPGADSVYVFERDAEKATELLSNADLIIALDFNTPKRMAEVEPVVLAAEGKKIMIDHHLNPGDFADIVISHPEISSTSELVFRLICRMGDFSKINLACAECIYTGMMSDTGGFTYNSNDQEIYVIISELIKLGVDKDEIYRKVFNTYSDHRLRLMGYCLYEKMKVYPEYKSALITLTAEEMERFNYVNGDSEGFVNIPLSIQGIDFSVFMREETDKIKISLRSQGTFPTNKFADDVFGGGGHLNASGGEFYGSMEEAVKIFEDTLPAYRDFF
ncbi:MAG: DHH family phosphoesterase [Bacteroidales bacterium 36-12]|nr:MAG: DHH family phosphoesterase [Bacteroidales bacterium 36-12]